MSGRITPNQHEILSAQSTATTTPEYLKSTSGALHTLATISPAGTTVTGTATATTTASTSVVAASGSASLRTYITSIQLANTGAATTLITIQDGSGGTALLYSIAPAGGGSNILLSNPIKTTANTALYFACGTASTTVYISAQGYLAA